MAEDRRLEARPILDPMPGSRDPVVQRPVHAIIESYEGSSYVPGGQHQWQVFRFTSNPTAQFRVRSGMVYGEKGTFAEASSTTFNDPKGEHKVWVKITVNSGTREVTSAEIQNGESIPENTATSIHYELAKIINAYSGSWYSIVDQTRWEPIYLSDGGGDGVNHPWKVEASGQTDEAGYPEWNVTGDTVWSQNGSVVVDDTAFNAGSGFVYLEIVRDPNSRSVTNASINNGDSIPGNDYYNQYRALAEIISTTVDGKTTYSVLQLQFEEIRIHELMIVTNGAFELAPFELSSRTTYDPPAP